MSEVKNVLLGIANIETFPMIALAIFVLVFAGVIVWVARMKKSHAEAMGRLPLEESHSEGVSSHE